MIQSVHFASVDWRSEGQCFLVLFYPCCNSHIALQYSLESDSSRRVCFSSMPNGAYNALSASVFEDVSFYFETPFQFSTSLVSSPARTHILLIDSSLLFMFQTILPMITWHSVFKILLLLNKFVYWPSVSHPCIWLSALIFSVLMSKISWMYTSGLTSEFPFFFLILLHFINIILWYCTRGPGISIIQSPIPPSLSPLLSLL